jgi:hypothetical protein
MVDIIPPSSLVSQCAAHTLTSKWQATIQEVAHCTALDDTIFKNVLWSTSKFEMVDWAALWRRPMTPPKVRHVAYLKLTHSILNMNWQNKK